MGNREVGEAERCLVKWGGGREGGRCVKDGL